MQIFDDGSTLSSGGVATNSTDAVGSAGFNDFWQTFANQTLSLGFGYGKAKLQQNLDQPVPTTAAARPLDAVPVMFAGSDPTLLLVGAGLVLYLLLRD